MKIMKLFAKLLFIEVNGRADFRRKEKEKKKQTENWTNNYENIPCACSALMCWMDGKRWAKKFVMSIVCSSDDDREFGIYTLNSC